MQAYTEDPGVASAWAASSYLHEAPSYSIALHVVLLQRADLRTRGLGIASFLRDKTKAASESLKQRDWTREQQALSSIKTWGTGYASAVPKELH